MSNWKLIDTGGTTRDFETFYNFRVRFAPGAGMAGINNSSTEFGLIDGGVMTHIRAPVRSFQLLGVITGSSVADLHKSRKALIDAVKPDRTACPLAPVVIQYVGSACTLQASAHFDGGLEFGSDFSVYDELDVGLKFIQPDPYWETTVTASAALTTSSTIANANYIIQRTASGTWQALDGGMGNTVLAITACDSGTIYAGGDFVTAGSISACRVAALRGGAWRRVGNGFNDQVLALAIGQDGTLWSGGTYTTTCGGGVTVNRVAKFSTATCAWTAASTGMNSAVYDLAAIGDAMFAVGDMTTAGGTSVCCVAAWSTSTWSAPGSGGLTIAGTGGLAEVIFKANNGDVIVGGTFDQAKGTTACHVARFTPSTASWNPLGGGVTGVTVRSLAQAPDGMIYAGGNFITANNNTTSVCRAGQFNGAGWFPMAYGIGSVVESMAYDTVNKRLYAATGCLINGPAIPDKLSMWTGTDWQPIGLDLPGNATVYALHYNSTCNLLTVGFNTSGTASAAAVTSVTNNGNAAVYPILSCSAPTSTSAQLFQLVNETTGDAIYFNLVLSAGEVATLDLRKRTFSTNFRSNVISGIHPSSDLASWRLMPGANTISFYMSSGSGSAKLTWYPRFWGIDS